MTTPNSDNTSNVVQALRDIRDEINKEIREMTFEEERAYLDQLLASNRPPAPNPAFEKLGQP